MQLRFLPASEADIPLIYAQCVALVEAYEDMERIDRESVFAWLRRKIQSNIREYTCVWVQGQKAAFYHLSPGEDTWELDDLYVLEPFRNRGIGSAILKKCCEEASKPLFLYVFTGNRRAMELYRRHGFTVTETVGDTRCIMTRRP